MKTPPSISPAHGQSLGQLSYVRRPRATPRTEKMPSRTHGNGTFFNRSAFQKKFGNSGAQPHFRFVNEKKSHSEQPNWDGIPEKYRADVEKMASASYGARGVAESFPQFRERIAGLWKAQKREFHRMTQDQGFQRMPRIDANAPFAILAMTVNGSLVAMTAPDQNGLRNMRYIPISERRQQPTDFPNTFLRISVESDGNTPVINNHFVPGHGYWRSSRIIAIAAHANANQQVLWDAQQQLSLSIIDVRAKTIAPRDIPE